LLLCSEGQRLFLLPAVSIPRIEKSQKSEVTSRSTSGSARSNSTESGNDLVADAMKQINAGKKPAA
jgi:hypothetical protein